MQEQVQCAADDGGAANLQVVPFAIRIPEEEEESAMRKCAITAVALLATASMSMGGMASFSFEPTELLSGTVVEIPVWATGDAEADAMTLAVEVQAPLEILCITATGAGFYFYPSNDGGVSWIESQTATFDVVNPSRDIHLPPLSATPSLMAMVRVYTPVGTPFGAYSISTVIGAYGGYASALAYGGTALDVTQAQMFMPLDTPEPATVLLLLGVLPFVRRRFR